MALEAKVATTKTTTIMRRSAVSFDHRVLVKRTLHLNDYTEDEIGAC
jgi:hypothetical protein